MPVDLKCIDKADEILGWMQSKGSTPASRRRAELSELRAAANRINANLRQPAFGDQTNLNDESSWLWEALAIDGSALDTAVSASDFLWNEEQVIDMVEEVQRQQWF